MFFHAAQLRRLAFLAQSGKVSVTPEPFGFVLLSYVNEDDAVRTGIRHALVGRAGGVCVTTIQGDIAWLSHNSTATSWRAYGPDGKGPMTSVLPAIEPSDVVLSRV